MKIHKEQAEIEELIKQKEKSLFEDRIELKKREKLLIDEKVSLRMGAFVDCFRLFMEKQTKNTQVSVYLNTSLLESVLRSYFYDIYKFKNFSASEWANRNKHAAYIIKWIVRFRPIQIREHTKNVTSEIADINLKFALICGFGFLYKEITNFIMENKRQKQEEFSFYNGLMYDLRYRYLSGKKLILTFEAIELALKFKNTGSYKK